MQAILKTIKNPIIEMNKKANTSTIQINENEKVKTRKTLKIEKIHYAQECQNLAQDIKDCRFRMEQNEILFNLETDPILIEQRIFERSALNCRYQYLIKRARFLKLRLGAINV